LPQSNFPLSNSMKTLILYAVVILTLCARPLCGQGIRLYDQQATNLVEGVATFANDYQPVGQSFTPTLSSIGFIELLFFDADIFSTNGNLVTINLRSNAITGPILATTTSFAVSNEFFGIADFFFSSPVPVVPGVTYYLQPFIQLGDAVNAPLTDGSYPGGTAFSQGVPFPNYDLWFREGVVVPEPSSVGLALVGAGLLGLARWRRGRGRRSSV